MKCCKRSFQPHKLSKQLFKIDERMKRKFNLSKSIGIAKEHNQAQAAAAPAARLSKSELAAQVDEQIKPQGEQKAKPAAKKSLPKKRNRKPITDIFSTTAEDADLLKTLVQRAEKVGTLSNKSEVIRAGLRALDSLPNDQFSKVLLSVPRARPGRPRQSLDRDQ
jgi:hypothetical protein